MEIEGSIDPEMCETLCVFYIWLFKIRIHVFMRSIQLEGSVTMTFKSQLTFWTETMEVSPIEAQMYFPKVETIPYAPWRRHIYTY